MPLYNPLDEVKRSAQNLTRIAAERDEAKKQLDEKEKQLALMTRYATVVAFLLGVAVIIVFWLAFQ